MSDDRRVEIPLRHLPLLVTSLNRSDTEFCLEVAKNADKFWVHFRDNVAEICETEKPTAETLSVTSMTGAKIKHLNRVGQVLKLSEPVNFIYNDRQIFFDKVDLSNLVIFKKHLDHQVDITRKYFDWPQGEICDTGLTLQEAWNNFNK